jgi:hypothetical protein
MSSPEEIGPLNLLSLRISPPNTPAAEPAVDDGEDSLFIPDDPPIAPQPAQPAAAAQMEGPISQATRPYMASGQVGKTNTSEIPKAWRDGRRRIAGCIGISAKT